MNERVKVILAVILVISAIGFGIAGFCVPPVGVVSSSLLWLIAQFLLVSATFLGIDAAVLEIIKRRA